MDNKVLLRKIYAFYKILLFLVTFIVFLHVYKKPFYYYDVIFLIYLLDATLFFVVENVYFIAASLGMDILFVCFVAKILSIEGLIIFSVAPLFFSCFFVECFLSTMLLGTSFVVVFFYTGLNVVFAIISYISAFTTSYLAVKSLKQKELIRKKEEFNKEFDDKIYIAKRISLEFAHEIRNPLMGISGAMEILKTTKDEKTKNEMIDIALQEIDRANNLTRDFLNLERPYNANKAEFELCGFLKKAAENKRGLIEIDVECDELPLFLDADEEMLNRMFDNLIKNSIEAHADKITIKVFNEKNQRIVLVFEDNGEGLCVGSSDDDKIFLPFFTTKEHGSGLGLAICKQIAKVHDGDIFIHNKNAFEIVLKGKINAG